MLAPVIIYIESPKPTLKAWSDSPNVKIENI